VATLGVHRAQFLEVYSKLHRPIDAEIDGVVASVVRAAAVRVLVCVRVLVTVTAAVVATAAAAAGSL
jgi:hypothetical protein